MAAVGTSLYSSSQAAKAGAKQFGAQAKAESESIERANLQNIVRSHYQAGMLNMNLGMEKKQLVQEGFTHTVDYQKMSQAQQANAAASGTVGASVDAVSNDISMKLGEAQAQGRENYEQLLTDYLVQLDMLSTNAEFSTVKAKQYDYQGPSSSDMWANALLAGTSTFMGTYGARRMDLNLGKPAGTALNFNEMGGNMSYRMPGNLGV